MNANKLLIVYLHSMILHKARERGRERERAAPGCLLSSKARLSAPLIVCVCVCVCARARVCVGISRYINMYHPPHTSGQVPPLAQRSASVAAVGLAADVHTHGGDGSYISRYSCISSWQAEVRTRIRKDLEKKTYSAANETS
jgi:hypothetical protein